MQNSIFVFSTPFIIARSAGYGALCFLALVGCSLVLLYTYWVYLSIGFLIFFSFNYSCVLLLCVVGVGCFSAAVDRLRRRRCCRRCRRRRPSAAAPPCAAERPPGPRLPACLSAPGRVGVKTSPGGWAPAGPGPHVPVARGRHAPPLPPIKASVPISRGSGCEYPGEGRRGGHEGFRQTRTEAR